MRHQLLGALVALAAALGPAAALGFDWTEKVDFSGFAQADVRFNIEDWRGAEHGQGYNFSVNRNDLNLRLDVTPVEQVAAVAEGRLRLYGFNEANDLAANSDRNKVDPFSVQLDQAFVAVKGVPFKWMDLKVGRMTQTWGQADMFNPTDNLSPRDFSDPMDFARKVPNQMVQVDIYPTDWLSITAVWVPIFKPSQLPPSTPLAFATEVDQNGCFSSAPAAPLSAQNAQQLASTFGAVDRCTLNFNDTRVVNYLPKNTLANSQAGLRARMSLGDLDLGLSYYYGRNSFPVAFNAAARTTPSTTPGRLLDVAYTAEVLYPRMQVAGLDFSYSSEWLLDIGFVGELAVIFPEEVVFAVQAYQGDAPVFAEPLSNVNVPSKPFIKATLGLDYTFKFGLYVNAMYVHGFFDEFNDLYGLHDYVVLTPEYKFWRDSLALRVSAVLDCTDLSNQINPQLTWIAMPGVEVQLGAWIYGGSTRVPVEDQLDYSARKKFGQKAAGRNVAFLRTKVTW